jgi:glutamate formiminotransferase
MCNPLIWSAVNVSEGRREQVLKSLADSLLADGLPLADWSSDIDHNRSVFSLIGDQDQLSRALRKIFCWAEQHLDVRSHDGQHPWLGAVDVVPFAPVGQTTMEQARQVGWACAGLIAQEFGVPIFLYRESSAAKDQPLTLPALRRGGLQGLALRLRSGEIASDLGPGLPHPSLGVSVFGARPPLVAYNCLLDTTDLELGKQIAALVREKGGGPRGLQALAFALEHQGGAVQISMNLLEPQETPPHLAFLKVEEVARSWGARVVSSEVVGLVPQEALRAAFQHFLKIQELRPRQVVEENLIGGSSTSHA